MDEMFRTGATDLTEFEREAPYFNRSLGLARFRDINKDLTS